MIIGITGGIGSGKSAIARQLRAMGYAVYDTDSEAKRLIVEDAHVRQKMEQLFGQEVYADGVYQTALVAQRVFTNKSLLAQLNAIVHPAVKADIRRWTTNDHLSSTGSHSNPQKSDLQRKDFLFIECAILYQAGFDQLCDKVVMITAPEAIRIERTIARDQTTMDKVSARIHAQDVEGDIQRADIVIDNDGTIPITTLCEKIITIIGSYGGN